MLRVAVVSCLAFSFLATNAEAQVPQVVAEVQHHGRDLTVYVNGVPISHSPPEMGTHVLRIESFLMNGANEVRVEWRRMQEGMHPFSAAIRVAGNDGMTDLAQTAEIQDDTIGGTHSRTLRFEQEFSRPWAWTRAPALQLSDEHREEIGTVVLALHSAYATSNVSRAVELTRLMWTEMSGYDETAVERVQGRYQELMAAPDWGVEPLVREDLRFESFGRLVRVWRNGTLIRSADEGNTRLSVDGLYLAKIDGTWTVVRPVT